MPDPRTLMIIVMHQDATSDEISRVVTRLASLGAEVSVREQDGRTVIAGSVESLLRDKAPWVDMAGVDHIAPEVPGGRRVGRESRSDDSIVDVGGVLVGGSRITVVAGPCAVESRTQLIETAEAVSLGGAHILRGDAFKPRTSPYSFQGLGKEGLEILAEARELTGLPFVAEVLDPRDVDLVASYADMLRVGTRNMSNHALLKELGRQSLPVQLKRGRAATIGEWIDAAEYVFSEGNPNVVMVERGIRGFDDRSRNTLDLTAVPIVKLETHLPVMVDPSHASGRRELVESLALAAVAAGADGLMIDVHSSPESAQVDGDQALLPPEFSSLMDRVSSIATALGRSV